MKAVAIFLGSLAVMAGLAGCFGKDDAPVDTNAEQEKIDKILGQEGREKVIDAAAIVPKNFSFPGQQLLPAKRLTFTGSVGPDAMGGYEAERDVGGIDYRTIEQTFDLGAALPPGQPAELQIKLYWDGSEANGGDLDIVVDVPGTKTSYSPESETFNWNYVTKTLVVDTVGVAGQPAKVGVQIASALVSQGFSYKLEVAVAYPKDVLTPYHAWALDVPPGASGLILESEKAGGDEHINASFILLDPEDKLVAFVQYDDINVPTQSLFIPTAKSGTYVFHAYEMRGGFLRVKADVPLAMSQARALPLKSAATVLSSAPTPGIAGKDPLSGQMSEDTGATATSFTPAGAFPLRVEGYIKGQASAMAKVTLKSPLGVVHQLASIARYEDESGSLGYTSNHAGSSDNVHTWKNIQKGAWTAEVVNDGPSVEIGYTVLTYTR